MPVKCPGAAQKIVYMAGQYWRRHGFSGAIDQRLRVATPSLSSVPEYTPTLEGVAGSPLADASGWIAVDASTLQHRRYGSVFGCRRRDVGATSKTAAAVRAQLPVAVANLEAVMSGEAPRLRYSCYASCPLITAYGRVVLAEFEYEKRVRPSLPWDSTRERRSAWWLNTLVLPWMYWQRLLKGRGLPLVQRHWAPAGEMGASEWHSSRALSFKRTR